MKGISLFQACKITGGKIEIFVLAKRKFPLNLHHLWLKGKPVLWKGKIDCGNSSVGRAQPCQGWGRGSESRFPLKPPDEFGELQFFFSLHYSVH